MAGVHDDEAGCARLSCCEGGLCRWGEVGRPGAPSSTASRSSGGSTPRWQATTSTCLQVDRVGEVLVGRAEELDRVVEGGAVTRIHGDAKGWNFFFGGFCVV